MSRTPLVRPTFLLACGLGAMQVGAFCPPVHAPGERGSFELRSVELDAQDDDDTPDDDDSAVEVEPPELRDSWVGPLVAATPIDGWIGDAPVLDGTTLCFELRYLADDPNEDGPSPSCWELVVEGSAEPAGPQPERIACLRFSEGEAVLRAEARDCADPEPVIEDSWMIPVVPRDEVSLALVPGPEYAAPSYFVGGGGEPLPDAWATPWPDPLLVHPEQTLELNLALLHPSSPRPVAWNPRDATLEVVADGLPPERIPRVDEDGEPRLDPPQTPLLRFPIGASARLRLDFGDFAPTSGEVRAAAPDAVDEIELRVVYAPLEPDEEWNPALPGPVQGAHALARDARGTPILGVPSEWSVGGRSLALAAGLGGWMPAAGYVQIEDICDPPTQRAGERRAVLRAEFDGVRAERAIAWWNREDPEADDTDWEQPEHCLPAGCGCTSAACALVRPASPAEPVMLALLLPVALLRRRR